MKNKLAKITTIVFLIVGIFLITQSVQAAYGDTSTYVGKLYGGDGGAAINAYLDFPEDITVDSSRNFYIADTYNNVIRKIDTSGNISTVAGTGSYGSDNGASTLAEFALPRGVAVDSSQNVYVADTLNSQIRKISSSGSVSSLVSSGLSNPEGVAVYGSTLYIADTGNNALKKISISGGSVTTVTPGLSAPKKIAINSTGTTAYIANNGNYNVVKVNLSSGSITLVAGSGTAGYQEGTGASAKFENIWGVALADNNTLFVSDGDGFSDYVREIDLTTNTTSLFASDTNMASINFPSGLVAYNNYVYVANQGIGTIEKFNNISGDSERGASETFAGAERFGNKNGSASNALFGRPYDLAMTQDRTYIYVADNNKVRRITRATGQVSHVIGSSVDNYREGTDQNPAVRFSTIQGITVNSGGTALYVADRWNNRIRKIDLTASPRESSLLSGVGLINTNGSQNNGYQEGTRCVSEFDTGVSGCAYFQNPAGIVISPDNQYLYVTDTGNNRIRKVRISDGQTSLVAGSGQTGYADGAGSSAKFNKPFGIAIDSGGDYLYVADTNNHRIRKINIATGVVSTLAGSGSPGYQDAVGTQAFFSYPEYVKMGADGLLYVTEVGSHRIRQVNPENGVTKLVSGSGGRGFKNGTKSQAEFNNLKGMAIDTTSNTLYVADSWNDIIRAVDITGQAPFTDPAPEVTAITPNFHEASGDASATTMLLVNGKNFRHGASAKLGSVAVNKTYVQSSSSLAIEVPLGRMSGGVYDLRVDNSDGQYDVLERAFSITVNGQTPNIYYEAEGADSNVAPGNTFFAYDKNLRGGFYIGGGDVTGDSKEEIITGTADGFGPQIIIFDQDGNIKGQFFAYFSYLRSGVRMTTCNLTGDDKEEIVTAPGPGGRPHIRIFNAQGQDVLPSFFALDGLFTGGAYVACGDVTGNGRNEIIVTAGKGGGAHVTVHNAEGKIIANFFAYNQYTFRKGIKVSVLDFDNDGKDEIITGPEYGSPHIQMFSVETNQVRQLNPGFYAFDPEYKGGVSVVGADTDGDGKDEIIVGVGLDAQPVVKVYNKDGSLVLKQFYVFGDNFRGGVNVTSADSDGDGKDEVIAMPRSGGSPTVKIIDVDEL